MKLSLWTLKRYNYRVEPPNIGHTGEGTSILCIVQRLLDVEQYIGRGEQCVHCREVVHSSECPLSEVPLYTC